MSYLSYADCRSLRRAYESFSKSFSFSKMLEKRGKNYSIIVTALRSLLIHAWENILAKDGISIRSGSIFIDSIADYRDLIKILIRLKGAILFTENVQMQCHLNRYGQLLCGDAAYYEKHSKSLIEFVYKVDSKEEELGNMLLRPSRPQDDCICEKEPVFIIANINSVGGGALSVEEGRRLQREYRVCMLSLYPTCSKTIDKDKKTLIQPTYTSLLEVPVIIPKDKMGKLLGSHGRKVNYGYSIYLPLDRNFGNSHSPRMLASDFMIPERMLEEGSIWREMP